MSTDSTRMKTVARAAVIAAVAAGMLSACSGSGKESPTTTTPTTATTSSSSAPQTSAPAVTPSEKGGPTKGGNKFTPTVTAPGPQTALPGNIITGPH